LRGVDASDSSTSKDIGVESRALSLLSMVPGKPVSLKLRLLPLEKKILST